MKAFIVNTYGKKNKLELAELPDPVILENEVLVQIHAASINQLDSKIKNGEFKFILPYKMPIVLGHDVSGVVTKVGTKVSRFKIGDEIYARPADFSIGTFAEFISINENDVALKPDILTMEEAASIPLIGLTAWQTLIDVANLKAGQKVFIQAGSGGVGTFAIQLAKYLGATVATTTSAANFDLVKSLGADIVIDYRKEDFETVLNNYDVVLNSQDIKILEKSLHILKPGGKAISISGPPTTAFAREFKLPWYVNLVAQFLSSGIAAKAKKLNVDFLFHLMKANGKQLNEITSLINSGKIRPVVDKIFPFTETNEALAYVETGRAKGKVIIKVK
ncbi:MAG: NADP-dependent oxidoreductase [Spirosoma sp.]|nr:NADP-dependent oxidoreductase [Spirosoma sp.]